MRTPSVSELISIFVCTAAASIIGVQLAIFLFPMPASPDRLEPPSATMIIDDVGFGAVIGVPLFEAMHCGQEGHRMVCESENYVFQSKKFY